MPPPPNTPLNGITGFSLFEHPVFLTARDLSVLNLFSISAIFGAFYDVTEKSNMYRISFFCTYLFSIITSFFVLNLYTICPKSSDPIPIVTYYIKWATTAWTHSINLTAQTSMKRYNGVRSEVKDIEKDANIEII